MEKSKRKEEIKMENMRLLIKKSVEVRENKDIPVSKKYILRKHNQRALKR